MPDPEEESRGFGSQRPCFFVCSFVFINVIFLIYQSDTKIRAKTRSHTATKPFFPFNYECSKCARAGWPGSDF